MIWSANLFHGGKRQADGRRTRWSQVTHYFFENCNYYTPLQSEESIAMVYLRSVTDIASGEVRSSRTAESLRQAAVVRSGLPDDFDPAFYLTANPDVKAARVDPAEHLLKHGRFEKRRWRQ